MKSLRSFLITTISFAVVFVSFQSVSVLNVRAQDSKIAVQRGYRTGYSDGYMSGYRDAIDNAARDYERHQEYAKGDRAYAKEYGALEDYRDGYQQGFEVGYDTGFDKKSFDAALPTDLKKRGIAASRRAADENRETRPTSPVRDEIQNPVVADRSENVVTAPPPRNETISRNETINYVQTGDQAVLIPVDTELIVELQDGIDTEHSKEGDRFQARVVSPAEISGALIEGRIAKIQKPGRIQRRAEMTLSFDRIILSENRWANYHAILSEVLPIKGDNVRSVDMEGTVEGKSSVKSDSIKVGASTGTGLVVGAIAGGPVGAAVGAGVGAAFGVGAVVVERGKDIQLAKGQQLRIKTTYETQIR